MKKQHKTDKHEETTKSKGHAKAKKPYAAPKLTNQGKLSQITAGSGTRYA